MPCLRKSFFSSCTPLGQKSSDGDACARHLTFGLNPIKQASPGRKAQQKEPSQKRSAWGSLLAPQHPRRPWGCPGAAPAIPLLLEDADEQWPRGDRSQLPCPILSKRSGLAGRQDGETCSPHWGTIFFDSMVLEIPPRRNRGGGRGFPSANYHAVISQSGSPCQGIRQSIVPYSINLYNKCLILQAPCRKINPNTSPLFFFFSWLGCLPAPCSTSSDAARWRREGACPVRWDGGDRHGDRDGAPPMSPASRIAALGALVLWQRCHQWEAHPRREPGPRAASGSAGAARQWQGCFHL